VLEKADEKERDGGETRRFKYIRHIREACGRTLQYPQTPCNEFAVHSGLARPMETQVLSNNHDQQLQSNYSGVWVDNPMAHCTRGILI